MTIGIIDGGISEKNEFIAPYVIARETYVPSEYQNTRHATFIASTILYGNKLNGIERKISKRFKFVDIIAVPNSNPSYGPVDHIGEIELMEILIETMEKYSSTVKIWNISLGTSNLVANNCISDLAVFLDDLQDKYHVQIFLASGNLGRPFREWPCSGEMGERDRITAPADSVRSITVGSVALFDSADSIVKLNEPSPFSRRGPGANFTVKPEVVDYGGNIAYDGTILGLGIRGLSEDGYVIEGIGTSYANPRVVQKFASIYDELVDRDMLLS